MPLTQEYLRSALHYDPLTGAFTWLTNRASNKVKAGDPAGVVKKGYLVICIDNVHYRANRLAVFYMTGVWPRVADHKDGNTLNNAWENIRDVTKGQNGLNRKLSARNSLGVKGVSILPSGRYRAQIMYQGKKEYLGSFDSIEQASEAYQTAAKSRFGEFNREQ